MNGFQAPCHGGHEVHIFTRAQAPVWERLGFGYRERKGLTCSFMGRYKWGCKSPNLGYNQSYPAYNPTYSYP